jgi:hypothetical protein
MPLRNECEVGAFGLLVSGAVDGVGAGCVERDLVVVVLRLRVHGRGGCDGRVVSEAGGGVGGGDGLGRVDEGVEGQLGLRGGEGSVVGVVGALISRRLRGAERVLGAECFRIPSRPRGHVRFRGERVRGEAGTVPGLGCSGIPRFGIRLLEGDCRGHVLLGVDIAWHRPRLEGRPLRCHHDHRQHCRQRLSRHLGFHQLLSDSNKVNPNAPQTCKMTHTH